MKTHSERRRIHWRNVPRPFILGVGGLLAGLALSLQLAGPAPWLRLDTYFFDTLTRLHAGTRVSDRVVIADIDDISLSAIGQWPWARYRVASLIRAIGDGGAKAVGINILFSEPDRASLSTLRDTFRREFGVDLGFSGVPAGLDDNDAYLGAVLADSRAVGSIVFLTDLENTAPACVPSPVDARGRIEVLSPVTATGILCNTPKLQAGLRTFGFINTVTDFDGVLRRLPMVYAYQDRWHPSFSLALLMRVTGADSIAVVTDGYGPMLRVGSLVIPVNEQGMALLRHQGPAHAHRRYSALDILRNEIPSGSLAGRIVLVGSTATGLTDLHRTAMGPDLPGVEVHASLIDGALNGAFYREPAWQKAYSRLATSAAGLLVAVLFACAGTVQAWAAAAALLLCFTGLGVVVFLGAGVLLPVAGPLVTIVGESLVLSFLLYRRQERMERLSRRARDEAEAVSRAKSAFLANMSHEIRTPLHGVLSAADLLLSGGLDSGQREYVEIIRSSGKTLLILLNDVLDFSKVEAGKLELESIEFDLRTGVESLIRLLALQAQEKALDLVCHFEPNVPTALIGDFTRLCQILTNMIGNAIKFTQRGEVVLRIALANERDEDVTLRFTISDTGIGIPPDRLDRLFNPFVQLDSSTNRTHGGTGLGLAISKRLVELMQGEIGVSSELGHGSRFWFTASFGKPPESPSIGDLFGRSAFQRILLAGENRTYLEWLSDWITAWGCRCEIATGFDDAGNRLRVAGAANEPFDVALLDLRTRDPEPSLAVLFQRGTRCLAEQVKWIALTGPIREGQLQSYLAVGISACLKAPVTQSSLYDCLAGLSTGSSVEYLKSVPETKFRSISPASVPPRLQRILVAEDNPVNSKLLLAILDQLGYQADAVSNGQECLRALSDRSYDAVLMDCQMPGMDGYEATRHIRGAVSPVSNPAIPIIALTANAMPGDRERCILAGMDGYLTKPIQLDRLKQVLTEYLPGSGSCGDPSTSNSGLAATEPVSETFDRSALLRRLIGDETIARDVIASFLDDTPKRLAGLLDALDAEDWVRARREAHTIKGASANLGIKSLAALAAAAEESVSSGRIDESRGAAQHLRLDFERVRRQIQAAEERAASGASIRDDSGGDVAVPR